MTVQPRRPDDQHHAAGSAEASQTAKTKADSASEAGAKRGFFGRIRHLFSGVEDDASRDLKERRTKILAGEKKVKAEGQERRTLQKSMKEKHEEATKKYDSLIAEFSRVPDKQRLEGQIKAALKTVNQRSGNLRIVEAAVSAFDEYQKVAKELRNTPHPTQSLLERVKEAREKLEDANLELLSLNSLATVKEIANDILQDKLDASEACEQARAKHRELFESLKKTDPFSKELLEFLPKETANHLLSCDAKAGNVHDSYIQLQTVSSNLERTYKFNDFIANRKRELTEFREIESLPDPKVEIDRAESFMMDPTGFQEKLDVSLEVASKVGRGDMRVVLSNLRAFNNHPNQELAISARNRYNAILHSLYRFNEAVIALPDPNSIASLEMERLLSEARAAVVKAVAEGEAFIKEHGPAPS